MVDPPPPRHLTRLPESSSDTIQIATHLMRLRLQVTRQHVDLTEIQADMSNFAGDIWGQAFRVAERSYRIGFAPFNVREVRRSKLLMEIHQHFMHLMCTAKIDLVHGLEQSNYALKFMLCLRDERRRFWEAFYSDLSDDEVANCASYPCTDRANTEYFDMDHLTLVQAVATGRTAVQSITTFLA